MLRTPLYEVHQRLGARLIDFGGWEMPVMYRGISEEHLHTRTACSVFDVSHMGRLFLAGADAESLLQRLCTRNVGKLRPGRSGYSHICNEQGGVLDDVIVSRYESQWLVVCNAGNRGKIVDHFKAHAAGRNVSLDDQTTQTAMLAVQGPATMGLLGDHLPMKIGELPRFGFVSGSYMGQKYSVFRSGYTGEDGVEVILPAGVAVLAWEYLTREGTGGRAVVRPAGLGARDTLRLEAAMPLYGHELGEQADPLSAGCGWCVDLNKEFIGAAALRRVRTEGPKRRIAGLVLEGKRIARQGSRVMTGDRAVGEVTSGTLSPTLEKSIALAYVDSGALDAGAGLSVEIRDQRVGASVVSLPFYKRAG